MTQKVLAVFDQNSKTAGIKLDLNEQPYKTDMERIKEYSVSTFEVLCERVAMYGSNG